MSDTVGRSWLPWAYETVAFRQEILGELGLCFRDVGCLSYQALELGPTPETGI